MTKEPVWFRQDREAIAYLRARGIDPSTFAREAFRAILQVMRARESTDELGRVQARLLRPVEALVREDRDRKRGSEDWEDGHEHGAP